jgi:hypothetical protein
MRPFQTIAFLSLHASFPSIFGLVERKQWLLFVQPRLSNSAKWREDQCAKFTPMSYL